MVGVLKVCDTEIHISYSQGQHAAREWKIGTELHELVFKCSLESDSCDCKACALDTRQLL